MNDRPRPSRPAAPTGDEDPVDHPDAATRVVDETLADLCAEVLAGAFYDDPLWSWAFPDDDRRLDQHRACWRMCVEGAIRYPWVRLTADGAATAVWIPPGGTEMTDEGAERLEALIVELLGPGAGRALGALEALEEAHPRSEQHFYLSLLGTDPARRGHGHGLRLLAETLSEIDQLGMPAYLEASNVANVPLYARYGFALHGVAHVPGGGPDVVTMWRDPRPARAED